jgi:hypothetical protein
VHTSFGGTKGDSRVIHLAGMRNFCLHENVAILIVKIITNRSMIKLVNRIRGIRDKGIGGNC